MQLDKEYHTLKTMRKTRIVCTIGDARKKLEFRNPSNPNGFRSDVRKQLARDIQVFVKAGMDIARINMAHFDVKDNTKPYNDRIYLEDMIQTIRDVMAETGQKIAIIGDIQGPKVRLAEKEIKLPLINESGSLCKILLLRSKDLPNWKTGAEGEDRVVGFRHDGDFNFIRSIHRNWKNKKKPIELQIGDDGPIFKVLKFVDNFKGVLCEIKAPTQQNDNKEIVILGERAGVSVKNTKISTGEYILDGNYYPKDEADLRFLLIDNALDDKILVDFIALSFVKSDFDIDGLQEFIKKSVPIKEIHRRYGTGMNDFPVISKIEDEEGLKNLPQIIERSFGIMVARGDLGLHCPIRQVAKHQKHIVDDCNQRERPVIVATQMLESMIDKPEPTRAESTDVFNAVLDGADALMLSGETAKGQYPKEAIQMMASIIEEAEMELRDRKDYDIRIAQLQKAIVKRFIKLRAKLKSTQVESHKRYVVTKSELERRENTHQLAYSACAKACQLDCDAIVVLTENGEIARLISRFKPEKRLISGVYTNESGRLLRLSYGVEPYVIKNEGDVFQQFREVVSASGLPTLRSSHSRRVIGVAEYKCSKEVIPILAIFHYLEFK